MSSSRTSTLENLRATHGAASLDTLAGSRHANMKELRFDAADGVGGSPSPSTRCGRPWSSAVKTSPAAANAASIRQFIDKADTRFDSHLAALKTEPTKGQPKKKGRRS